VPFIAEPIQLSEQQRSDLNEIAQSRSLPAGFVFRSKLILMLAEGAPFAAIKERLQTTAPTISRWNSGSWSMDWKVWTRVIRDNRRSS
jgi:hypothetical protein